MSGKEEDKIRKITALLEKGGTMLASHHECGAPMFRYLGKIVCPVCDFQEIQEKPEAKEIKETKHGQKPLKTIIAQAEQGKQTPETDYRTISRVVANKIHEIAAGLETETDLQRVKNKMECIEQGIRILKLLED